MSRIARVVAPGYPHHITQRGNNRQDVFFVPDDRRAYLEILQGQARRFGLLLDGYCLMGNHVHVIATPRRKDSLAKAIGRTNWIYARYVNRLHGRSGHLWQNRFYSCPLDEGAWWGAMCYVERNPVRAGLARRPWDYPWSSAQAHCGGGASPAPARASDSRPAARAPAAPRAESEARGPRADDSAGRGRHPAAGSAPADLLDLASWRKALGRRDWRQFLREGLDDRQTRALRRATLTGRPLGSDSFLSKLETALGRRLRAGPVGRPRQRKPK